MKQRNILEYHVFNKEIGPTRGEEHGPNAPAMGADVDHHFLRLQFRHLHVLAVESAQNKKKK